MMSKLINMVMGSAAIASLDADDAIVKVEVIVVPPNTRSPATFNPIPSVTYHCIVQRESAAMAVMESSVETKPSFGSTSFFNFVLESPAIGFYCEDGVIELVAGVIRASVLCEDSGMRLQETTGTEQEKGFSSNSIGSRGVEIEIEAPRVTWFKGGINEG
ncbi:hypothetical protein ACH5RR_015639 [Cinchona calisaya]|uniref:Uncharacterized protein n=1 Tax=Cinchona calisaya TaxID=153742 RepID=A0ABD2ZWV1_9GENT